MKRKQRLRTCSIQNCPNYSGTSDDTVDMFRAPKYDPTRSEWIRIVRENSQSVGDFHQTCHLHFDKSQIQQGSNGKRKLKTGTIPTIFEATSEIITEPNPLGNYLENSSASDHHMYDQELKKRLNLEIELLKVKEQMAKLKSENEFLKSKNNELDKVLNSRDEKIRALISNLSDADKTLFECLLGSKKKQFDPTVRSFSITMQSFSRQAYEYLREKFHGNLPHVNTIGHWHLNANFGERSGITKAAILKLEELASSFRSEGKMLYASLCFDEMAMRKHLHWRDSDKRFLGFVDIWKRSEHNDCPISTQVLVFMLNGVNVEFSIPVAYYFITSLNAQEKKTVLLDVIKAISNAGVKIVNLTFDGLSSNSGMCNQLGASFDLASPKTYFLNPSDGSKIFIMLDACHMLKLLRNCIATFDLRDGDGRLISWNFFKSLETFRKKHNLVTHKMNKKHIEWTKNKMNVSIAAQTLSKSVADSMEYLMRDGSKNFQGCEGTIKFVRTANTLFDIFNSSKVKTSDKFKSPLVLDSIQSISEFTTEAMKYLSNLKMNGKSIMTSQRKTGFKGFVINIHSLFGIWNELEIAEGKSLPTYTLSQDPLESFFGRIRSCLGNNDNPNQEQFTAAYRRQLMPNEIKSSDHANCHDNLRILHITSSNKCFRDEPSEEDKQNNRKEIEKLTNAPEFINQTLDKIQRTSIACTASLIEQKIETAQFECDICENVFELNEKFEGIFNDSTHVPCKSSVAICEHTMKFVDILRVEHHLDYDLLLERILLTLDIDELFLNSDFSHDPCHKDWIVRFFVEDFFRIQAVYIARNLTMDQKKFVRTMFRKQIHRLNE